MSERTAVITGGTAGIGKAVAFSFLRAGYRVAVCGRSEDKLSSVRREAEQAGFSLFTYRADVTEIASLRAFSEAVTDCLGGIDVWVNNAGITLPRKFFYEYTPAEFDAVVAGNMKSVFFGSAIASEAMRSRGGVILQTSSFTADTPTCGAALYGATKAAVENLTRTMAAELAPLHIRVLAVQPAYVLHRPRDHPLHLPRHQKASRDRCQ